jgi:hypothetical protein
VDAIEVKMIEVRLVPTAWEGSNQYKRVSRGTMKTPPPIPIIEAIVPIKNPNIGNRYSIIFFPSIRSFKRLSLRNIAKYPWKTGILFLENG